MDDATSDTYSAFFVDEEGTQSCFRAFSEVIETKGLFNSLYADRAGHYWHTPAAGGKVDKANPTQVGRALAQLGIELIPAYSARPGGARACSAPCSACPRSSGWPASPTWPRPTASSRRSFCPSTMLALPARPRSRGRPSVPGPAPEADILSIQEERTVGNDNTVRYKRLALQIPEDRHRHHYVKAKVKVHEYHDGQLAIFHGPRCLARYNPDGRQRKETSKQAA